MLRVKRPLCVLLVLLTAGILLFYHGDSRGPDPMDIDEVTLVGEICDLSGMDDNLSLMIGDVLTETGESLPNKVKVYAGKQYGRDEKACSFRDLNIGSVVRLSGSLEGFRRPGNPGQFDEYAYNQSQGIEARMFAKEVSVVRDNPDRIAMGLYHIRSFFYHIFFELLPEKEAGILAAMVLGEKSGLEEETKELFRENGIAHILAISGLHISLIGMGLFAFLRKFIMPMSWAVLVTGIVLFLYGLLIGFPLATRRAVIMTLLVLMARLLGERYDRLNALALAAIVELVTHPASLGQSGFLLSYGTVLGIILFVGELERISIGKKDSVGDKLLRVSAGSIGVFLVTLPILVQCYHEVAVFSVPVNVVLLPLMSYLLGVALLGGGAAFVSVTIGRFFLGTAFGILTLYQRICQWISQIPWHSVIIGQRSTGGVILYYLGLSFVVFLLKRKRVTGKHFVPWFPDSGLMKPLTLVGVTALNLVLFLVPVTSGPGQVFPSLARPGLTITNLDVGQGDCTCIRFPDGRTVLIDGGSTDVKEVAKYRIVPYLKYMGIDTIDMMVVTHSDEDHVNGLEEILTKDGHFGLRVGSVVLPEVDDPDDNYIQLEHEVRQAGVEISYVKAGNEMTLSGARLTCLHPSEGYNWEDVNDYSTVLELSYGSFRGLFTGDLGFHGEESLTEEPGRCGLSLEDVDYLKVGHHGSKNSSSESFLSKIRPEIAVASAGEGNRYHHPSSEAVDRLETAGAAFYCTIDSGAVTTWTDGTQIRVSEYKTVEER
ncbi:MAG: DNA internalization-related competence protein ComEC/Rec2 [Eubacterium sp.]|nr:DNA internalization-related competence protein ComEC/Rec2 [Eubacterium sp.]